jgi:hypothetical protein
MKEENKETTKIAVIISIIANAILEIIKIIFV